MPFASDVSDLADTLTEQSSCPRCAGRGWFLECTGPVFPDDYTDVVCPCGGSEEDRIDIDDGAFALAVIEEFQGIDLYTDQCVFEAVRHKLGPNASDDVLTMMAEEYKRRARQAQRRVRSSRQRSLH